MVISLLLLGQLLLAGLLTLLPVSTLLLGSVRTFAASASLSLVAFHLLPEALEKAGAGAFVLFALGFVFPEWVEHRRIAAHRRAHDGATHPPVAGLEVAFWGLFVHRLFDGWALSVLLHPLNVVGLLALSVHAVPEMGTVMLSFRDRRGVLAGWVRGGLLTAAALAGALTSKSLLGIADFNLGWLMAGTAGLLAHLAWHLLPPRRSALLKIQTAHVACAAAGFFAPLLLGHEHHHVGVAHVFEGLLLALAPPWLFALILGAALSTFQAWSAARKAEAHSSPAVFVLSIPLLGFWLALLRLLAAQAVAHFARWAAHKVLPPAPPPSHDDSSGTHGSGSHQDAPHHTGAQHHTEQLSATTDQNPPSPIAGFIHRLTTQAHSFGLSILFGTILAAYLQTFVPSKLIAEWFQGWGGLLLALALALPASFLERALLPVAAVLLFGGASPGVVLVWLVMAGGIRSAQPSPRHHWSFRSLLPTLLLAALFVLLLGALADHHRAALPAPLAFTKITLWHYLALPLVLFLVATSLFKHGITESVSSLLGRPAKPHLHHH